jgi:MipA family protein
MHQVSHHSGRKYPRHIFNRPARAALTTLLVFAGHQVFAQAADKTKDVSPWEVSLGAGVTSAPEYEGAKKSVTGLTPIFGVSYKTKDYGTFSVGGKGLGVSWTAIDKDEYSLGLSLGQSAGRVDNKDGTAFRPGSKRLKGMGEIESGTEIGLFGHYTVGVPIQLEWVKGSGDGKADAKTQKIKGHGGSRFTLSTAIPWQVSNDFTLSFSPNIVWADKKYNQTYFGVTSVQSANSGFKAYNARQGIKSVGLTIGADYKITPQWSANASMSFDQLRGDAAKSPLVQKKSQNTFFIGANYTF